MSQNEAVMSVHGVVSQESMHKDQHVRDVNHLLGYYLCLNTYWKTLEVLKTKKYYFHMTS